MPRLLEFRSELMPDGEVRLNGTGMSAGSWTVPADLAALRKQPAQALWNLTCELMAVLQVFRHVRVAERELAELGFRPPGFRAPGGFRPLRLVEFCADVDGGGRMTLNGAPVADMSVPGVLDEDTVKRLDPERRELLFRRLEQVRDTLRRAYLAARVAAGELVEVDGELRPTARAATAVWISDPGVVRA